MRAVEIWNEDTKEYKVEGSQRHGKDLFVVRPYEKEFREIYRNFEKTGQDTWMEEFELEVKDKCWMEETRWGAALEYSDNEFYAHKDVLNRGFTEEELRFVNAYRNRFVVIRIAENGTRPHFPDYQSIYVWDGVKNAYIYDNETKEKYRMDVETYHIPFKKFKQQLKQLNLI